MNNRLAIVLGLGFVSGVIGPSIVACSVPNPDHCVNNGGDSYCEAEHPDWDNAYCSDNSCVDEVTDDGCQQELPVGCHYCNGRDAMECSESSSGDGDGDLTGDGDGDTTTTGDGDGDATGDGDGDGDVPECMSSSECADPMMPLCDDGACVACGDAAAASCAEDYPETVVCADDGQCVECTVEDTSACGVDTPACVDNVCVPCTEHEQCPASACNLESGVCMPEDRVWWVDSSNGPGGDGSEGNPYQSLDDALGNIAVGEEGTIKVVAAGLYGQFEPAAGTTVALLGVNFPVFQANTDVLVVSAGSSVFVKGVEVSNGATRGVACSAGSVWLYDSVIRNNTTRGVSVDECDVWVRRTSIYENDQDGIYLIGGQLSVVNSFVGGDVNGVAAVNILGGNASISYSTLAVAFGGAAGVRCSNGGENVQVMNSLVVNQDGSNEIDMCSGGDFAGTATEQGLEGTVALGDFDTGWFENFADGDFHLTDMAPAELATAATWQEGDPRTDIDGDPRPTEPGTSDYAGADIP